VHVFVYIYVSVYVYPYIWMSSVDVGVGVVPSIRSPIPRSTWVFLFGIFSMSAHCLGVGRCLSDMAGVCLSGLSPSLLSPS